MNLKGNKNTKERRRKEEHIHYTILKERNPNYYPRIPRLRSINAVFIGIGRIWKTRRSHTSKSKPGPIKMPRFHGISMVKLGPITLNFGHIVRLASNTLYIYLVLQYLNVYFFRYIIKYEIQCIN